MYKRKTNVVERTKETATPIAFISFKTQKTFTMENGFRAISYRITERLYSTCLETLVLETGNEGGELFVFIAEVSFFFLTIEESLKTLATHIILSWLIHGGDL